MKNKNIQYGLLLYMLKGIKSLWKGFLYPLLAIIGLYTIVSWYWDTYVFGIQHNDNFATLIVVENGGDTTHVCKMIPPGKLKFEFKHDQPDYQVTIDEYDGHSMYEFYRVSKKSANIFLTEFDDANSRKPLKKTIFQGGMTTIKKF